MLDSLNVTLWKSGLWYHPLKSVVVFFSGGQITNQRIVLILLRIDFRLCYNESISVLPTALGWSPYFSIVAFLDFQQNSQSILQGLSSLIGSGLQYYFNTEISEISLQPSASKQVFCQALWSLALCLHTLGFSCGPEGNPCADFEGSISAASSLYLSLVICPTNSSSFNSPKLWTLFLHPVDFSSLLGICFPVP